MMNEPRRVSRAVTPLSGTAIPPKANGLRFPLKEEALAALVRSALEEDGAFNDITTIATVSSDRRARASLVAREGGVVSGVALAVEAFRQLDPKAAMRIDAEDGTKVKAGEQVISISGHARGILSAERVALNFMQRLSGIATLTARYVEAVAGTKAKILDTRKTLPGWRHLEKYAVRCGGGVNHRLDLTSQVLIKDNHIAASNGDVAEVVRRARALAPKDAKVEIECDRIEQVETALAVGADIILLDNMTTDELRACVELVNGRAILEASGGVRLDTVRAIAETGVDWISSGSMTHSAKAMDLALDFE